MKSLRYKVKKKMTHTFFAATYKRCKQYPPNFCGSFFEGISDEFGLRDECIHLSVFTWRPHATDGVQGFLRHALNTEEVSAPCGSAGGSSELMHIETAQAAKGHF